MKAERELIINQRIHSEYNGLFNDIALCMGALREGSIIRQHVLQFDGLCRGMQTQLENPFKLKRAQWANLDEATFKTLVVSLLSGKWVLLRQVVQQRFTGSPYVEALDELDPIAHRYYQRLRMVMINEGKVRGLSESSPLVYLGPIARLFLFDEEAPCLISAPFGAANAADPEGRELCRQTIPHEVGHAIFEQISGFLDELKFKVGTGLAPGVTKKQKFIRSVILNWLEEMVADIAGTALAGKVFAESARRINIMPERLVGITDGDHPIPLLRSFIHGWVLQQIDPQAAIPFNQDLTAVTSSYLNRAFESLPSLIPVTMKEVRDELLIIVDRVWNCELQTLQGSSLGRIFQVVSQSEAPSDRQEAVPAWGSSVEGNVDALLRLVGPVSPASALPNSPLNFDLICCNIRLQACCSQPIM